jgi:hypothetical protein
MKSKQHQEAGKRRQAKLTDEEKKALHDKMMEGQRRWREKMKRLVEAAKEATAQ